MKYFYKIAFVFLIVLIVWHFFSTTEYFSQKEKKLINVYQNYFNMAKPYVKKGFNTLSIKERKQFEKKGNDFQKDMIKYRKGLSEKQMVKIQNELRLLEKKIFQ